MKQKIEIEKKVDQIMNSLDGIQRATPQPWLFSRIKGKLIQQDDKSVWGTIGSFLSKPVIAIAGLCLILMMNGYLLFNQYKEPSSAILIGQNEELLDSESLMASGSSFDYETLLQP